MIRSTACDAGQQSLEIGNVLRNNKDFGFRATSQHLETPTQNAAKADWELKWWENQPQPHVSKPYTDEAPKEEDALSNISSDSNYQLDQELSEGEWDISSSTSSGRFNPRTTEDTLNEGPHCEEQKQRNGIAVAGMRIAPSREEDFPQFNRSRFDYNSNSTSFVSGLNQRNRNQRPIHRRHHYNNRNAYWKAKESSYVNGANSWIPQRSFSQDVPTTSHKRYSSGQWGIKNSYEEASNSNFCRGSDIENGSRKRKHSEEDFSMATEGKRMRRNYPMGIESRDMSVDLKHPGAVNLTLDENISKTQPNRRIPSQTFNRRSSANNVSQREEVTHVRREILPSAAEALPNSSEVKLGKPRPIIIDGCNLAKGYSHGDKFDFKGIETCVNHFVKEGHQAITAVVPEWCFRKGCSNIANQQVLYRLKEEKRLVESWSREVGNGKWVNSYDDRLILDIATKCDGVIISNDKHKDLLDEPQFCDTIRNRVIPFRFIPGMPEEIMLPHDPFGRDGPKLKEILHF